MYISTSIRAPRQTAYIRNSLNSDLWFDLSGGTAASREASDKVSHDFLALGVTIGANLGPEGFEGIAKFTGATEVTERNLRLARSSCTRSGSGWSMSESLSLW